MPLKLIAPTEWVGVFGKCSNCGAPVVSYTCNELLIDERPQAIEWDYWVACAEQNCKNSYGEGYFQEMPNFVKE